jgi:hypothetical protein
MEQWTRDKPTARQLEYLKDLGYRGIPPQNKSVAHSLIQLYQRKQMSRANAGQSASLGRQGGGG